MTSFTRAFIRHVGRTEVPVEYLRWAALSVQAAALGDRVWFEKFKGSKLTPNLYVFLIGPSGLGKGLAIDAAMNLTRHMPLFGQYRGQITSPAIVDWIVKRQKDTKIVDPSRLYLVTPEVSMAVGNGEMADRLVKFMTEIYTGGAYELEEGTRTSGLHTIPCPTTNWLAGTTEEWLVASITLDAITSGFFARVFPVTATYDFSRRVRKPEQPDDYEWLVARLRRRLVTLSTRISGRMQLSAQADVLDEYWYNTREVPTDEAMLPTWKRAHDMTYKLGMVLAKDENPFARLILRRHLAAAQDLVEAMHSVVPRLITLASCTPESDALRFVQRIIQGSTTAIDEPDLIWRASQRGLTKERTMIVVETLQAAGKLAVVPTTAGGNSYRWKRRRLPKN